MPLNYDPQRPPGMFPWIDIAESRIPLAVYYILGAVCGVCGYFIGLSQQIVPTPICVALGLVVGLLSVPLTLKFLSFMICTALVGLAAWATFWMMNGSAPKQTSRKPAAVTASPSTVGQTLLDQLFHGGRR